MRESHVLFAQTKKKKEHKAATFISLPSLFAAYSASGGEYVTSSSLKLKSSFSYGKKKKRTEQQLKGTSSFFFFSFNVGIIIRWR